MDWNNLNEEKQAELIITHLLQIAAADQKYDNRELAYIVEVAKNIGLKESRLQQIISSFPEVEFHPPTDESERMALLYYMLFLMKVDKSITEQEERLIYTFGFKMGFNELMIRDLISVIRKYRQEKIPPNELIDKIKKYLN